MRRLALAVAGFLGVMTVAFAAYTMSQRPADLASIRQQVTPRLEAEMAAAGVAFGQPIFLRVFKESDELEVWVRTGDRFLLWRAP